ncbi:hypothetical protein PLICRDRAFT_36431 [Plicaturopsis crispa FD-325 SS-3]|nr:hypothetical protein PLICRDRAFT_36431 [Plicaturopsis crispa FD-325 SS-3]
MLDLSGPPHFPRAVFALYRSYVRETRNLPHIYLRQFFRLKAADEFRVLLNARKVQVRETKFRRAQLELRKVRKANQGAAWAFDHVLDLAYGRKGKLWHELLNPLLTNPGAPLPPRIISGVDRSRPPAFSPEITALLTSGPSRRTVPLKLSALQTPPLLPARADPTSEEARLLGRLSKRREVNLRWRIFKKEIAKILPPLQVNVKEAGDPNESTIGFSSNADAARTGIRGFGFQGSGIMEELIDIAGPTIRPKPLTRREKRREGISTATATTSPFDSPPRHPRWLRRRYKELLYRIPLLTYTPRNLPSPEKRPGGKYTVSLTENALSTRIRSSPKRLPYIDDVGMAWVQDTARAETRGKGRPKNK